MVKTKQPAPTGARKTAKTGIEQKGQPHAQAYAETPAYHAEIASDVKRALYSLTEETYRRGRDITPADRQTMKDGIDGLVDGITRTDPKLVYGLHAALVVETANRAGLGREAGLHYINALAAQLAERAGLKPYEEKPREGTAPHFGKGYALHPDLAALLSQYLGKGQPQGPQAAYKPN